MALLSFEKPEKVLTDAQWRAISADGAPPGVYTPNMTDEDKERWKAKLIKGKDARIEIRKCFMGLGYYAQVCIIVYKQTSEEFADVVISTNGKIGASFQQIEEMHQVINEAKTILNNL
jgi:hypothetical protein